METRNFDRFRAIMNGMAKVYEREIDDALLDAYWLVLDDWSLDEFAAAAKHLMGTQARGMPRPAEFRALRRTAAPTPGEAWASVITHCRGAYRQNPTLDGGGLIDRAATTLGGYAVIAHTETMKLGFLERRFCEHYEALLNAQETRSAMPALTVESRAWTDRIRLDTLLKNR